MFIPAYTLLQFSREWNEKWGMGYIQRMREVDDRSFVIKIRGNKGTEDLFISLNGLMAIESKRKWAPLEKQKRIVNNTKKIIENQRVEKVELGGMDRVIIIHAEKIKIIIELFGGGNIIVTDPEWKIIEGETVREWKDRTIKKGEIYKLPKGPRAWNKWEEKMEDIPESIVQKSIDRWMVENNIEEPMREYLYAHIKPKMDREGQSLTEKQYREIRKQLIEWYDNETREYGFVQTQKGKCPFPCVLPEISAEENIHEKIENEWLDEKENQTSELVHKKETSSRKKSALDVALERQEGLINKWEEENVTWQKRGEWVYEHYAEVEALLLAVRNGMNKKISPKKILETIQEKMPIVKKIDPSTGEITVETEY